MILTELLKSHLSLGTIIDINENIIKLIKQYLIKYGYVNNDGVLSPEEFHSILVLVKEFMGIEENGIGPKTLKMMQCPRCSFPDVLPLNMSQGKWNKSKLTFTITGWVGGNISKDEQIAITKQAFQSISDVCNMSATYITAGQADITIKKAKQDGSSGTLAYAYLANGSDEPLDLVLDTDELWDNFGSIKQGSIYLLNVLTHELCHNLGLGHSKSNIALMAPFYRANIATPQKNDDIPRLQNLYGPPKNNPSPPNPPHNPNPNPNPSPVPGKTSLVIDWDKRTLSADGFRISKIGN